VPAFVVPELHAEREVIIITAVADIGVENKQRTKSRPGTGPNGTLFDV